MGGSGGGGYGQMSSSVKFGGSTNAGVSQIEMEINEFLEQLLKEYNSRDVEAIKKHLSEIEKALGKDIEELDRILFGGSVSKSTYIEGVSDVDALVIINGNLSDISPIKLQKSFCDLLNKRFPNTEIQKGNLAVTVKFHDYEIQLLPAIRVNGSLHIPSGKAAQWSSPVDSKAFISALTQANKNNNNKVVPVIKLAKGLLSKLPEKHQLSGYHVEALAVEVFRGYNGKNTLFDMTKHFLSQTEKKILSPISDRTGQSKAIDEDLGQPNSLTRQHISKQIKAINGKFANAGAVAVTKSLFD